MFELCLILLVLSIVCLLVEMFIPGFGVFGISGIILMIISAVLAVMYVPNGWLVVGAEGVVLALMLAFMFSYIKRAQLHGRLIMNESLNEDTTPLGDLESLIGKEGVALTPLRPFGVAEFNGSQLEVASNGPFVEKGTKIIVSGVEKTKIIVSVRKQ